MISDGSLLVADLAADILDDIEPLTCLQLPAPSCMGEDWAAFASSQLALLQCDGIALKRCVRHAPGAASPQPRIDRWLAEHARVYRHQMHGIGNAPATVSTLRTSSCETQVQRVRFAGVSQCGMAASAGKVPRQHGSCLALARSGKSSFVGPSWGSQGRHRTTCSASSFELALANV